MGATLLPFAPRTEAIWGFPAEAEPQEMRDGIARARGGDAVRLRARGSEENCVIVDVGIDIVDDAEEEEARPPHEAAAAARAAILPEEGRREIERGHVCLHARTHERGAPLSVSRAREKGKREISLARFERK